MQTSFITRRGRTYEVIRDEHGRLAKFVKPAKEVKPTSKTKTKKTSK